jgi:hypothetical protein
MGGTGVGWARQATIGLPKYARRREKRFTLVEQGGVVGRVVI